MCRSCPLVAVGFEVHGNANKTAEPPALNGHGGATESLAKTLLSSGL